ncbi:hypothetical protein CGSHiII_09708 [Haemophilus influenzae PittII]|nr:hypothetical protein CGSHiII_09708 [Haemophilus influenzae PittII]
MRNQQSKDLNGYTVNLQDIIVRVKTPCAVTDLS